MTTIPNRIEKQIRLRAPRSRVWRAITNAKEFGSWFGVSLVGEFAAKQPIEGKITLSDVEGGTLLNVSESGFDRVPLARRAKAFEMNDMGWGMQMKQIEKYLENAGE